MPRDSQQVVVNLEVAEPVRRAVGPTAWFVLEALAARGSNVSTTFELFCNIRELSAAIGLSKDTIARALRALDEAELVFRSDYRNRRSGRFDRSMYFVDLGAAGLRIEPTEPDPDAIEATRADAQLSLLN